MHYEMIMENTISNELPLVNSQTNVKAPRKSGVELLKIFAIIFIVVCHAVEGASGMNGDSASISGFWLGFLGALGLMGDVIFLVSSAYFLLESKRVQIRKIVYMILAVWTISMVYFVIYLGLGYEMSAKVIVRQVFPTIFQNNWFISYYLVLYLIHPLLNKIIERLNKLTLGCVAGFLFIHCCCVIFAIGNAPGYNKFLCILAIYFIVAFLKNYAPKLMQSTKANAIIFVVSALAYIAMQVAVYILSFKIDYLAPRRITYFHINNPIQLVMCISMLNLALKANWHSKAVNYISSLSMLIYLISHNYLFVMFTQQKWNEWFNARFGIGHGVASTLLLSVIFFVGSFVAGTIFVLTLKKPLNKLAKLVEDCIVKVASKVATALKSKREKRQNV